MNTVGIICKKELRRVLFDKKLVIALFVMPIVMMFIIYGLMAVLTINMMKDVAEHKSTVCVYQMPEAFQKMLESHGEETGEVTSISSEKEIQECKEKVLDGSLDYLIVFPDNLEKNVANYKKGDVIPQILTYYNPSTDYGKSVKSQYAGYLEDYRKELLKQRMGTLDAVQIFTVDSDNKESVLQDKNKAGGKLLGTMIPYMICMLLFAGVMALGTDAIAGEKERGTMATMLICPVKRSHIVYGKLLALMILSALSALVYGIGMLTSFPFLVKVMNENGVSFHISVLQAILMLLLIVSLVFVYVALIAVCSVFAKDVKEASTFVSPAYIIVIATGMMTMFVTGKTPTSSYCIPLYGSAIALRNILAQDITNAQTVFAIVVNVVIGAILAACVTKAFDSERIMFDA